MATGYTSIEINHCAKFLSIVGCPLIECVWLCMASRNQIIKSQLFTVCWAGCVLLKKTVLNQSKLQELLFLCPGVYFNALSLDSLGRGTFLYLLFVLFPLSPVLSVSCLSNELSYFFHYDEGPKVSGAEITHDTWLKEEDLPA